MEYKHKPVLLHKSIDYLNCREGGIYLDGTLGRGGHTEAIIKEINDKGMVVGIDRDLAAIREVKDKLGKYESIRLVHGNFIEIPEILDRLKLDKIDGMIFDLGVSSPQFDDPGRGFSYRNEGPLDMRMNKKQALTAGDIVNTYSQGELTRILKEYGEERWASRIAEFILDFREKKEISTTTGLVEVIKAAIPAGARRKGGHPARRTFQALRIATNNELDQLDKLINLVIPRIKAGGRLCIISFHSLEDRIVKHTFRELAKDCICPPDFPICVCDHKASVKVITKSPVQADGDELRENPRARSAKLRVAEVLN